MACCDFGKLCIDVYVEGCLFTSPHKSQAPQHGTLHELRIIQGKPIVIRYYSTIAALPVEVLNTKPYFYVPNSFKHILSQACRH